MGIQEEKTNAAQFPKVYYCRHMQPGVCKYEKEMVLVDTDAIKRMMPSAVGKPVYINHQKVELDVLKETAAGYITESFYNEIDGWAWFKILIIDDAAHAAIADGYAVSNAYRPLQYGAGGTKNNVPYDKEVQDAIFTHLAIVSNPRYEGAMIKTPEDFRRYQENKKEELAELQNSNPSKGQKTMFKLFKPSRQEVTIPDEDTLVDLGDGVSVPFKEMINAVAADKAAKKKAEDELRNKKNDDDMVECDGEKIPMKELVAAYKNAKMRKNESEEDKMKREMMEKKNAEDEEKKKAEAEEKKNAEEAEKKKKEEEEKTNSKFFDDLLNANKNYSSQNDRPKISAPQSGYTRGKQRYGSSAS